MAESKELQQKIINAIASGATRFGKIRVAVGGTDGYRQMDHELQRMRRAGTISFSAANGWTLVDRSSCSA